MMDIERMKKLTIEAGKLSFWLMNRKYYRLAAKVVSRFARRFNSLPDAAQDEIYYLFEGKPLERNRGKDL